GKSMLGMEKRVERDFLGEKEIEADAYYGISTVRAAENFPITGYKTHAELIKSLGIVKKAAALANAEAGNLRPDIARVIVMAAEEVMGGYMNDAFIVD